MPEDSEEDESNQVVEAEATGTSTSSATAEITRGFSANNIRERLKNDEYALALVLTSTRLENILSIGIQESVEIDEDQFDALWGNDTLGTYGQMCSQLNVFEDEFEQQIIDDVADLRNNLVHDYRFLSDIEDDTDLQREIEAAIENAIEFIEAVRV